MIKFYSYNEQLYIQLQDHVLLFSLVLFGQDSSLMKYYHLKMTLFTLFMITTVLIKLYRNFTNLFHVNSCRTVHFVVWCFEQVSLFWRYTDDLDQFLGSV